MKLPNNYGSIYKVKEKRRKQYIVRITTGWDDDGKQLKKTLGYVKTYSDGLQMLADYHNSPYDLNYKDVTFEMVWKDVLIDINKAIEEGKMSESNLKGLTSTYNNHLQPLYKVKIFDLKYKQMQNVIDSIKLGYTTKGYAKTICKKIFDKAIDIYELPIKNPTDKLKIGTKTKSDKHKPFKIEEINKLWKFKENDIVKIFLINLYGGERPNEIFTAEKANIFLDDNYFKSGSKTEAGKDRIIPIHPDIKPIFEEFCERDSQYPFQTIFDDFNYNKFSRESKKIMAELNFEHTPYDCRHTFITRMDKLGARDKLVKQIVGHSISDITETYTHRDVEDLFNEIKKLNYN